jgi:hypothetical protein
VTVGGRNGNDSGIHQLYRPSDIGLDSHQNLIVVDSRNQRVQEYFTNETVVTLPSSVYPFNVFINTFDDIYLANT